MLAAIASVPMLATTAADSMVAALATPAIDSNIEVATIAIDI